LGGKYVPRAVLFDFEPSVIGAVSANYRSGNFVNQKRVRG
jgi:hypothetical protein